MGLAWKGLDDRRYTTPLSFDLSFGLNMLSPFLCVLVAFFSDWSCSFWRPAGFPSSSSLLDELSPPGKPEVPSNIFNGCTFAQPVCYSNNLAIRNLEPRTPTVLSQSNPNWTNFFWGSRDVFRAVLRKSSLQTPILSVGGLFAVLRTSGRSPKIVAQGTFSKETEKTKMSMMISDTARLRQPLLRVVLSIAALSPPRVDLRHCPGLFLQLLKHRTCLCLTSSLLSRLPGFVFQILCLLYGLSDAGDAW